MRRMRFETLFFFSTERETIYPFSGLHQDREPDILLILMYMYPMRLCHVTLLDSLDDSHQRLLW